MSFAVKAGRRWDLVMRRMAYCGRAALAGFGARLLLGEWISLFRGMISFLRCGHTPASGYQSMISLFCRTRGWSNDALHACVKLAHRPYAIAPNNGIMGRLSRGELRSIGQQIHLNGFHVFSQRLPEHVCDRLLDFSLAAPCAALSTREGSPLLKYPRCNPLSETYRIRDLELLHNKDVQELMFDESLLAVAQSYLGCKPIIEKAVMLWSAAISGQASSDAAQLFHFDMDRIKWLKIFIYLTDVDERNGPHCFIKGTHKRSSQPASLLNRGYVRIPDEDIARHYAKERIKEFTGQRGMIIAEDTRGFHKGKAPVEGDRLILQFEYCNSLFGGVLRPASLPIGGNARFQRLVRQYKRTYSRYKIK